MGELLGRSPGTLLRTPGTGELVPPLGVRAVARRVMGTRGGGREVGEASGRKGREQGESGKGPCKALSPQRLVLQGARLSLNSGAAGDLEFSECHPTGRSGERFRRAFPAALQLQSAGGPGYPPCCVRSPGESSVGTAQTRPAPPAHGSPAQGRPRRGAALPSAGRPGAQPTRLPPSLPVPGSRPPGGLASEVQAGAWLGGGGQQRPHLGPGSRQLPPSPHFLFLVPKRL